MYVNTSSFKLSKFWSESRRIDIENHSKYLLSPDLSVCSIKQKHSLLIKYGSISSSSTLKLAVEVIVSLLKFYLL